MSIGSFIGDAIRDIIGGIVSATASGAGSIFTGGYGAFMAVPATATTIGAAESTSNRYANVQFRAGDAANVTTALENRPASISAYICIKY
jgi:hypothetical protein